MKDNKLEDLSKSALDFDKEDIADALEAMNEPETPGQLDVKALKAAGILRDINDIDMGTMVKKISRSVSLQQSLEDSSRNSHDHSSIKDYIEKQITFLERISNKTPKEIVSQLDMSQIKAYLKITAKMRDEDINEALIKKHLKNIKKKYS